jgi:hypothetical protein
VVVVVVGGSDVEVNGLMNDNVSNAEGVVCKQVV